MAESAYRTLRGGTAPFGGLQVILVGDFFQLPPVVARDESEDADSTLFETYSNPQSAFAFNSPAWKSLDLNVCYLSEQYRQDDPVFLEILSAIRAGTVSASHRALLQTRFSRSPADGITQFFSHNADVDRVNNAKLSRLSGDSRMFAMERHGPKQLTERLVRGCLSPETLTLKINARVMFTKNDTPRHRFVNGTIGEITGFSKEDGFPIVKTNAGHTIFVEPMEWSIEEGGRVLARIIQIPLRLAWAITVHKSQGLSLDAAHMDLSDAFEHGQGYVAISRVRTLAGLSLAGFNERALEVHPDIVARDVEFREASRVMEKTMANISVAEIQKRQNDFIRACGGSIEPTKKKYEADDNFAIVKPPEKERRWERTLELVREGKTIEEIAHARGRTPETITQHLGRTSFSREIASRRYFPLHGGERKNDRRNSCCIQETRHRVSETNLRSLQWALLVCHPSVCAAALSQRNIILYNLKMKQGNFPIIDEGDFRESIARAIEEKRHVEYSTEVLNEYEWYRAEFPKVFSLNQPARSVYGFRVVYQLKKGVSRDIEILGTQTFEKLARTIVRAMGWDYDHMHGFTIPGAERPASEMSPWPSPTALEFFEPHWEDDPFPTYKSDQIKICQIDYAKFPVLEFIFDFGDGHQFKIQYLNARPKRPGEQAANFPRVIAERGIPPEQYPPVEE